MAQNKEHRIGGWFGRLITRLVKQFFAHDVGRSSAALAYYLLFALFPFLIFLSSLLGLLQLDISAIIESLGRLLPDSVLTFIETYLQYVSETSSPTMLWFSLVFSVYFPMRAANCLMRAVRRAYHLPRPAGQITYTLKVLLYTVFMLVTIALTLGLMTVGNRILGILGRYVWLPPAFIQLWGRLRFVVLGIVVLAAVGILYAMAQDKRDPARKIAPGAFFSLAAWMALSATYSYYVENFSNYSIIYGALGTVIVLMIWLYLTALVLILGAELNDALAYMHTHDQRWRLWDEKHGRGRGALDADVSVQGRKSGT